MVGYKPGEQQLTSWEYWAAGASSGFVTRGLTQPLDVLKIRFQLQLEPIRRTSQTSKYRGMYHCVKTMVAEETFRSLWKGHVPAQVLSVLYASVQFSTFEWLTKYSSQHLQSGVTSEAGAASASLSSKQWSAPSGQTSAKLLQHFICGGLAAAAAVVVSHPADVVRTRLSGQGEPKVYKSLAHAVSQMLSREGPASFSKGLSANLMMSVPQAAIQFGIYSICNQVYVTIFGDADRFGLRCSSSCGAVAGVCAKLAVYPFDVAKKRLQVMGFEDARRPFGATAQYSGLVHCLASIVRQEGMRGVYKGTGWALIKAGVTSGLYFASYEACCRALHKYRHSSS